MGNSEASGILSPFGRHLGIVVQCVDAFAFQHERDVVEVGEKGHVYINRKNWQYARE
jgi:hypothetical protein